MPGICGFYSGSPADKAPLLVREMIAQLDVAAPKSRERIHYVDSANRFALGSSSLGIFSQTTAPARYLGGRFLCILDGEIHDADLVCGRLGQSVNGVRGIDHAEILLAIFVEEGVEGLGKVEGTFAAAILDTKDQVLTLVSDSFGTRPLYFAQVKDRIAFASRIAAVLTDADLPRDLDWQGVSQFFTFGHYFNDNTSLQAVRILPAGSIYQYDAKIQRGQLKRYWTTGDQTGVRLSDYATACEAVDDAFVAAVRRRSTNDELSIGLSLSGGLDARTILGVADTPTRLKTVCLGMAGSRDHVASNQLAAIAGCTHHSHLLDQQFLGSYRTHLENMVALTDGQYLSQCIVMPTLPLYDRLGIDILLRGHGGELLHMSKAYNYSLDAAAFQLKDELELVGWLWSHLQAYLLDGVDRPLFADRALNRETLARDSLASAVKSTPATKPTQQIAHLFVQQRICRETPLSLMKFRSVVEPRLPYIDRQLVELLLSIPSEWRMDDKLQAYILTKRLPQFCRVENTNNGSTLGAGRVKRTLAEFKMKVGSKLGLPGYQPYERLGLWLRRELAPLVREVLLDDSCLDGGVFDADTVRQVVDRHLSGAMNHTYLIMAMMVFQVGHQMLFRKSPLERHDIARQPLAI